MTAENEKPNGEEHIEPKTQTESSGGSFPPIQTKLGYGDGGMSKGRHRYLMGCLFSSKEGTKAARKLADIVESKLAKGESWLEDALRVAQRFNLSREEIDSYSQIVTRGEENRRAACLADFGERSLDGKPWTKDDQQLLSRFKITREEIDAEIKRRNGNVS